MTNRETLNEIQRAVVDGIGDLLSHELQFGEFDSLTRKSWGDATTALRTLKEAWNLLDTIAYIDTDIDIEQLPELSQSSMSAYGSSFGNRCYWQNVAVHRWLNDDADNETGIHDHRFDLDYDSA